MDGQARSPQELGELRGSGCTARARAEADDPQMMGVSDGKKAETAQTSCSCEERDKERSLARRKTQDQRQHFNHGSSSWGCASPLISSRFPFHAQDSSLALTALPILPIQVCSGLPSWHCCSSPQTLPCATHPSGKLPPFSFLKTSTGRAVSQSQQLPLGNYLCQREPDPFKVPEEPCLV